jgi:hypothetical protein
LLFLVLIIQTLYDTIENFGDNDRLMNTFNQIPINLRREAAKRAKLNV